jgi:hypothetical protein
MDFAHIWKSARTFGILPNTTHCTSIYNTLTSKNLTDQLRAHTRPGKLTSDIKPSRPQILHKAHQATLCPAPPLTIPKFNSLFLNLGISIISSSLSHTVVLPGKIPFLAPVPAKEGALNVVGARLAEGEGEGTREEDAANLVGVGLRLLGGSGAARVMLYLATLDGEGDGCLWDIRVDRGCNWFGRSVEGAKAIFSLARDDFDARRAIVISLNLR